MSRTPDSQSYPDQFALFNEAEQLTEPGTGVETSHGFDPGEDEQKSVSKSRRRKTPQGAIRHGPVVPPASDQTQKQREDYTRTDLKPVDPDHKYTGPGW